MGLRAHFAFSVLYVADLDGIEGRGRNAALAAQLADALPDIALWIDDGSPPREVLARKGTLPASVVPVVGSESLLSPMSVAALRGFTGQDYVLSLDFVDGRFAGAPSIMAQPEHWPSRVVVMTLARVGSGEGPDLDQVAEIVAQAGGRAVYAAGGVRDVRDLAALRDAGAAGVLVASALHSGAITAGDLKKIAGR